MVSRRSLALLTLAAVLSTACRAAAPDPAPEDLAERSLQRRAVEAALWGLPAVNCDLMLQEMLRKTAAEPNEILFWSRPADANNQTLTPNPDCIYLMCFYDTQASGPLVIEIPPAEGGSLAGNICNAWQMPLEDVGPEGADQGKGGKYLLLPPGFAGDAPEGYVALRSDTFGGFALLRSNLESHSDADVAQAVAYGKRVRVYPLAQAASPPATRYTDAADVLFDSTITYDERFYRALDRVVQREPWLERDRAMIDPLRTLGIEQGKAFAPDARTDLVLRAAAREARDLLEQRYEGGRLPPYWPGGRWMVAAAPEIVALYSSSYGDPASYPIDARALTYTLGFVGVKHLGKAQFYLLANRDRDGRGLDGARTYRLAVPPHVPAKRYWSATAYDRATHALIRGMPRASRASNSAEVSPNADGSVDVYFGPAAPPGKESNWVPTDPRGRFEVLFRFYGPEQALLDKTWRLSDIEEL